MAIEVDLKISNQNNKDYPLIILRKFFNMVFIEADGKTLHIYTAVVFAGAESENTVQNPYYHISGQKQCKLKFQYNVSNASATFEFKDLTRSFLAQKECIEQVWGKCELIENQTYLTDKIQEYYPNINLPETPGISDSCTMAISEPKNGNSHSCVVQLGDVQKDQLRQKAEYTLSGHKYSGLEAVNWIKTTISIGKNDGSFLEKRVLFNISFDGKMFTPDFTWYFAPPINYVVDVGEAEVVHGGTSEKNWVSTVADDTTVNFREWVETEDISQRKKARVNLKTLIASDQFGLSNKKISVKIGFSNPTKHENRQFFLGLIVAFLLSFCSDKTRLNDYLSCIRSFCMCTEACICDIIVNILGITMPIIIIMVFISVTLSPKVCFPHEIRTYHKIIRFIRYLGIFLFLCLAIYVYGIWYLTPRSFWEFISKSFNICEINTGIIITLLLCCFILNLIYLIYSVAIKKRNILNYL